MKNVNLDVILAELGFYPSITVVTKHGDGGRHKFVEVRLPNGASHKLHWSMSNSADADRRCALNIRMMVRKRMHTLGVERVIPIKSKPMTKEVLPHIAAPVRVAPPVPVEQPSILAYQPPKPQESSVTTETKRTFTKMSRLQIITVGKLLEEGSHLVDGVRAYREGWSDERIVELANAAHKDAPHVIKPDHVSDLRLEAYPDWRLRQRTDDDEVRSYKGKVMQRFAALEARIQALEDAATTPKPQPYGQQSAASAPWGNGSQHKASI